jgi:predicted PurR-regulated permease PerM
MLTPHDSAYPPPRERVPIRTILTTIGLILATCVVLLVVVEVKRVLVWMVIAAFFAVALHPLVNWVEQHVPWCRRSVATLLVFLLVFLGIAGLITLFVVPLAQEGSTLAKQLPDLIADARAGRGIIGDLLQRTHALEWLKQNQDKLKETVGGLGTPALTFLRSAATGVAGVLTIFVLSYLMVLQAPKIVDGFIALFEPARGKRIRRVGGDCARTITGYLSGNLLISVICGVLTFIVLAACHVKFAGLIALFVAIADLIPLVGATLGAVVACIAAFLHSVPVGIGVLVFFVLYQQLENHLLQPVIFSRTVKVNPLTVLIAILIGVELTGILGALLAIPVAGIIQIIARDVWDNRRGRPKDEPTVGEQEEPATGPVPEPA